MSDEYLEPLKRIAEAANGKIDEIGLLPDGSGFATMSMPLPKDHWLTKEGWNEPPAPMKIGLGDRRTELVNQVRLAAKYAVRASTMNGKLDDFDPDAMVNNFVVGLLGYYTPDGDSHV